MTAASLIFFCFWVNYYFLSCCSHSVLFILDFSSMSKYKSFFPISIGFFLHEGNYFSIMFVIIISAPFVPALPRIFVIHRLDFYYFTLLLFSSLTISSLAFSYIVFENSSQIAFSPLFILLFAATAAFLDISISCFSWLHMEPHMWRICGVI